MPIGRKDADAFTQGLDNRTQVVLGQANAVGRVDGNETGLIERHACLLERLAKLAAIGLNETNQGRKAGAISGGLGYLDAAGVDVGTNEQGLLAGKPCLEALVSFIDELVELLRLIGKPSFEAPLLTQQAGSAVGRDHGRLDHQGAAAAHGIDEGADAAGALAPSAFQKHARGKSLLQRSGDLNAVLAVTAAMQ